MHQICGIDFRSDLVSWGVGLVVVHPCALTSLMHAPTKSRTNNGLSATSSFCNSNNVSGVEIK